MCLTAAGIWKQEINTQPKETESLTTTLPNRREDVERPGPFINPKAKHNENFLCSEMDICDP